MFIATATGGTGHSRQSGGGCRLRPVRLTQHGYHNHGWNIPPVCLWNISEAVSRMVRPAWHGLAGPGGGPAALRKEAGVTTNGTGSPTAVRRDLGQRLRDLRQGRDLTVAEAASRVGFSQSKLTKIELAQVVAKRDEVLRLLDVYEETDPQQQAALLAMVRAGASKEWWENYHRFNPKLAMYLGLESVATTLQAYDTHLPLGLLQTPDYPPPLLPPPRPDLLPPS